MRPIVGMFMLSGGLVLAASLLQAAPAPSVSCDDAAFASFVRAAQSGPLEELRTFAETCADSANRAEALRLSARFAFERGRSDDAVTLIRQLPSASRLPGDHLLEGAALVAQQRETAAGMTLLRALDPATLEPVDQVRRLTALADGHRQAGDGVAALTALNEASALASGEELNRICRAAAELVAPLTDAELTRASGKFGPTPVRLTVATELARRAWKKKDVAAARQQLDEVLSAETVCPDRGEALKLRDQIEGGEWLRRGIGVILPLSGKFAAFGEAVRRGMEMAQAERPAKQKSVAFLFRDVGSDPAENSRAVERLVREDRVMAIIGPLTGGAALAAGEAAQKLHIPLLSLAQRDGVPEIGDFVFRDAMTNRRQVETLVRYAAEQKGNKRFAILAPENRLGQELSDLFAQAVERRGGKVVARQTYAESAIEFRAPVKLLKGESPDIPDPTDREARKHPRTTVEPPLPFDALFIPDVGERVGMIAPYLAYYGVSNIQLLGTSAWNTPDLLNKAGRYVEGAVLVDGFFPASDTPRVRDFVARYSERFGEEPSILAAQGYDLARLLLAQLDRAEIRNRVDLRNALEKMKPFPAITGDLTFDAVGDAVQPLVLLRIERGGIEELR